MLPHPMRCSTGVARSRAGVERSRRLARQPSRFSASRTTRKSSAMDATTVSSGRRGTGPGCVAAAAPRGRRGRRGDAGRRARQWLDVSGCRRALRAALPAAYRHGPAGSFGLSAAPAALAARSVEGAAMARRVSWRRRVHVYGTGARRALAAPRPANRTAGPGDPGSQHDAPADRSRHGVGPQRDQRRLRRVVGGNLIAGKIR